MKYFKVCSFFILCICSLSAVAQSKNELKTENEIWENPFPKDKLNTFYKVTTEYETPEANTIFNVKENSIEALYNWQGEKAPFSTITTNKEYSYYNLELEYKWGERKFAPRLEEKRDAGILFHIQGEKIIWPRSLECQIQEGDTGDLWVIRGPKVTVIEGNGNEKVLDSKMEKYLQNPKYENFEVEGWNKVRLEIRGAESAKYYVNGHLVNELKNLLDMNGNALSSGNISLQAEGAELTYRNVRIEEIKK
jgi:hypothetical protein